jgi:hypothetical protein
MLETKRTYLLLEKGMEENLLEISRKSRKFQEKFAGNG